MALDFPDWQRAVAGTLRSLGTLAWNGSQAVTSDVTLQPGERALVLLLSVSGQGGTGALVVAVRPTGQTFPITLNQQVYNAGFPGVTGTTTPYVAYVNTELQLQWHVSVNSSDPSGVGQVQIFADTALPELSLSTMVNALPVKLSPIVNHNAPLSVELMPNGDAPTFHADPGALIQLPNVVNRTWCHLKAPNPTFGRVALERVTISQYGLATAAGTALLTLEGTSTAPTGGTGMTNSSLDASALPVPHVAGSFVSAATFTTEPTAAGRIATLALPIAAALPVGPPVVFDFTALRSSMPEFYAGFGIGLIPIASNGFTGAPTFWIDWLWTEYT